MRYLVILPLLFICGALRAQNHIKCEIRGTIRNYKPGQRVYFLRAKLGHSLDSLTLTDSVFIFKDTTEISNEPEDNWAESNATLYLDHSGKGIDFKKIRVNSFPDYAIVHLEPGVTRVAVIDSLLKAHVVPPNPNSGHYTLDSIYTARYKKFSAAISQSGRLQKKDAFAFIESNRLAADSEQDRDLWNFVKIHPTSPVSLFILKHDDENYPDYDKLAPYFDALSSELKNTIFGKGYGAMLAGLKLTRTGARSPEFTMEDPNGKKVSLSSFRGKYILVDFWASWCKPCREENPSVVSAYKQFSDKNFAILGVSLDKAKDAWLKAITDDNLAWTQVSDLNFWNNAAAQLYSVKAIPQNFLLDPEGHIIAKNLFGERLIKTLKKIFEVGGNKEN